MLTNDARNRALRTFLQGIGYAILAAVVMVLLPVFTDAHGWNDFDWSLIGFSLAQAVGTAVLSFFMRKVLDPSSFPTPLPPADPGEPDDDAAGYGALELIIGVVVLLILIVVLLRVL